MKKILLSGIMLISGIGFGQWTTDYDVNTEVATGLTSDIQSIGTKDGKTYIVFWDETSGYKLRVQLLDADGNKVFGENGILANAIADNSTWTATRSCAVDDDGNLYIGFTATGDGNGYINKISPTGEQLFGENGIALSDAWDLKIAPSSSGGAIVGWTETGVGKMKIFESDGSTLFDTPITLTSPDTSRPFTGAGEIVSLSDGSFVVVFHTKTTSWNVQSIPFAQKYSADQVPMWTNPIQVSTQTLMSNRKYPIAVENDITYFGYYGSTGWRFDSFVQRINPDGTLPWGVDGTDFSLNDEFLEMETSFVFPEGDDVIWVACNLTNSTQSNYGVYVQKFTKETGERLLGDNAKEVFPINSDNFVHVGSIQIAQSRPLFLFSKGISNGVNEIQLGVVLLNEDGTNTWENVYEMIATSLGNKGRYDFTENVNGQSVAVWTENRNGSTRAYAQNYYIEPVAGTQDLNKSPHQLYPNPSKDWVHFNSKDKISKIEVYDTTGRMIQLVKDSQNIQVSRLAKGIYILKTTDVKGNTQTHKLIKN
jgi:hypothetical protein